MATSAKTSSPPAPALDALYDITVLAAEGRDDPAAVAALAGEHACRLLRVEAAAVFVWDARVGLLRPVYETPSDVQEGSQRPGEGLVGKVFETQAPVCVSDYAAYSDALASSRRRGMRGALAVPMTFAGAPVGVIGVWTYEPRDFAEEEVRLLALFAAQIAPAFEAARRSAERDFRERTLRALHHVSLTGAAAHQLSTVAEAACARGLELLDADSAYVLWYEPERDLLRLLAGVGRVAHRSDWRARPGEGIAGLAFQCRQTVLVEDYPSWERRLDWAVEAGVRSMLAVPLVIQDRAIGALAIGWYANRGLGPADSDALNLLGSQLAADLETTHLLESRERQVKSLTALHEVAVAASGVLDSHTLAQLGVDRARDALGVDSAVLRWWDQASGTLRLLASNDPHRAQPVLEVTPEQGVIGRAFRSRRPALIDGYERSDLALEHAAKDGVVTALGVPLMVGQQAVGALAVATYRPHAYDSEQIQLLQLLASQLAPAVEAARLADERERHLSTVSVLTEFATRAAGVLDPPALTRLTIEAAVRLFPGTSASLGVWDPASERLVVLADHQEQHAETLGRGEAAMGEAFERVEPVAIEDYQHYPRATAHSLAQGTRACLAVPLLAGQEPIGALGLRIFEERHLTADDVRLLQLLAAQAGPLLNAAQLHSDLARSERHLRGLHAAMSGGLMVFDAGGRVVEVNEAGLRIMGLERSQLDGRALPDIAGLTRFADDRDAVGASERPIAQALATARPVHNRVVGYRRPDGSEFWLQIDAVPVLDAQGRVEHVISSFIDVTSVKMAEAAKRENEAKSRFLAAMSHELRTPLNSILGFSQLLEQQTFGPLNDRQQRYLGHIDASGRHLLELVNDILDISKVAAGQMDLLVEDVHVEPVVEEVMGRVRPLADERKLWITYAASPGLVVRADRRRLQQVLFNLLSNAIKFTPEGGSVALAARRRGANGRISVSDNGLGIPKDQHARIFEEFTQVEDGRSRPHQGTGLGLSLTRRLVELMGGQMRLDSEVGRGSEFSFTLPLAKRR